MYSLSRRPTMIDMYILGFEKVIRDGVGVDYKFKRQNQRAPASLEVRRRDGLCLTLLCRRKGIEFKSSRQWFLSRKVAAQALSSFEKTRPITVQINCII